ncbi:putative citrate synthase [Toxoplasma gondii RUB]|nr:putative citrate synthase [Toxoplasma gondii GT1]KFG65555.1 putative citrate synthase [Toxoplasma gondii RUB]RQX71531.1 putative citrate synthase [Toxoplasma gondii CAST]
MAAAARTGLPLLRTQTFHARPQALELLRAIPLHNLQLSTCLKTNYSLIGQFNRASCHWRKSKVNSGHPVHWHSYPAPASLLPAFAVHPLCSATQGVSGSTRKWSGSRAPSRSQSGVHVPTAPSDCAFSPDWRSVCCSQTFSAVSTTTLERQITKENSKNGIECLNAESENCFGFALLLRHRCGLHSGSVDPPLCSLTRRKPTWQRQTTAFLSSTMARQPLETSYEQRKDSEFSPGLEGVVAGESAISSVGPASLAGLTYRGYRIDDLTEKATFEEVVFLLLHDRLPTKQELDAQHQELVLARRLPPSLKACLEYFPKNSHPMDVVRTGCSMMGMLEQENAPPDQQAKIGLRLIGMYSSMLLYWYHYAHHGIRICEETDPADSVAAHFLKLLNQHSSGPHPLEVKAVDISLILYAEHDFNASTFAARVTAATRSDIYSAICSAIGTLKGPLHGGANEAAIMFLRKLRDMQQADQELESIWRHHERVMGFGHRLYKEGDPRSHIMMKVALDLAQNAPKKDPNLVQIAQHIEERMEKEKHLPANVDFPCALAYHQCGIPTDLYTPLFVLARTAGWTAHIMEQRANNRLIRPVSHYVGPPVRPFPSFEEREKLANPSEQSRSRL